MRLTVTLVLLLVIGCAFARPSRNRGAERDADELRGGRGGERRGRGEPRGELDLEGEGRRGRGSSSEEDSRSSEEEDEDTTEATVAAEIRRRIQDAARDELRGGERREQRGQREGRGRRHGKGRKEMSLVSESKK